MEQTMQDKEVLLVNDGRTGEVGVVTGLNNDGTPKVTNAKPGNGQDFLRIDKHGDVLDNFFTNFFRQCKEPKHFGFYRTAVDGVENVAEALKELLKNPEANNELLARNRVDTEKYRQQEKVQGYQPIDESRINWQELEEKWGVKRQELEESGDLRKMLNYGKSGLVTVTPTFGEERFETEARLSFRSSADGAVRLVPHLIRKEPRLERAFEGYVFSSQDKENLTMTGNMGRVARLTDRRTGEAVPAYISIDRLTNNIVAVPVYKVRIPEKIGDTLLTEQEKQELRAGYPLLNKEITLANGRQFTATLQVNADQRGVEFVPLNARLKEEIAPKEQANAFRWLDAEGNIRAPKTFGGVTLTSEQQADYTAGKAILVKDMVRDKQGQPFTAYIQFNREEGRPKFHRSNPDVSQAKEVTPTSESRTQVAVNSEGKTNEATKHIKEPLRQGQTSPANTQQQPRQNRGVQNKPKGVGI